MNQEDVARMMALNFPTGYYKQAARIPPSKFLNVITQLARFPHVLEVGNTGAGKGLAASRSIEDAVDAGMKVISIYNAGREIETGYKRYPADGRLKKLVEMRGERPKRYNVKIYLPCCKGNTLERGTPQKIPDFFQLYSVPVASNSLNAELLSTISMVGLTDIGKQALDGIIGGFAKTDNLANLYYEMNQLIDHGLHDKQTHLWFNVATSKSRESLERIFFSLSRFRIMTDAKNPIAMTDTRFQKILNDQSEISVFTQLFTPEYLHPFFSLLTMQYIFENASHCKYPILIVANEIQKIMVNTANIRSNPAREMFSNKLAALVQGGRKHNIHFMGDTQILSEINPNFVSQALLMAFYTDIAGDKDYRAFGRKMLVGDGVVSLKDTLHFLKHDPTNLIFEYYVPIMNRSFYVRLPRTSHPYEGNKSDFMGYVKKQDDCDWIDISNVYEEIEANIRETVENTPAIKRYIENRKGDAAGEIKKIVDPKTAKKEKAKKHASTIEAREKHDSIMELLKSLGWRYGEQVPMTLKNIVYEKLGVHPKSIHRYLY